MIIVIFIKIKYFHLIKNSSYSFKILADLFASQNKLSISSISALLKQFI